MDEINEDGFVIVGEDGEISDWDLISLDSEEEADDIKKEVGSNFGSPSQDFIWIEKQSTEAAEDHGLCDRLVPSSEDDREDGASPVFFQDFEQLQDAMEEEALSNLDLSVVPELPATVTETDAASLGACSTESESYLSSLSLEEISTEYELTLHDQDSWSPAELFIFHSSQWDVRPQIDNRHHKTDFFSSRQRKRFSKFRKTCYNARRYIYV